MARLVEGKPPSYYTWKRFRKNYNAFGGLIFIALCFLTALLGYLVLPDSSRNANNQILELETLRPGTRVNILPVKKNIPESRKNIADIYWNGNDPKETDRPYSTITINYDSVVIQPYGTQDPALKEAYSLADILFSLNPDDISRTSNGVIYFTTVEGLKQSIKLEDAQARVKEKIEVRTYWLGTDRFGRDMLSRMLLGTRVSLAVGIISVSISLIVGIFLGALAGFFRGKTDVFIMWLINVVWSIPTFLLVMALSLVLGHGFWQVFLAVGLTMWVEVARVVRGQILGVRELEYVQAAKALGFRNGSIIFRHILPNISGPLLVIAAANFASAILLEAGLSFLGLGVQPPAPSWGVMVNENYGFIVLDAAYLAIMPGIAIMLLVLSFNMLGNGLRDAFDVKGRL